MEKSQLILESTNVYYNCSNFHGRIFYFGVIYSLTQLQQQQKSLYTEIRSVKILHYFLEAELTPTLLIPLIFI